MITSHRPSNAPSLSRGRLRRRSSGPKLGGEREGKSKLLRPSWLTLGAVVAAFSLLLTLLGYGYDTGYLEPFGLSPEDLQRTPLDLLMRSYRAVLVLIDFHGRLTDRMFRWEVIEEIWWNSWHGLLVVGALVSFLAYWWSTQKGAGRKKNGVWLSNVTAREIMADSERGTTVGIRWTIRCGAGVVRGALPCGHVLVACDRDPAAFRHSCSCSAIDGCGGQGDRVGDPPDWMQATCSASGYLPKRCTVREGGATGMRDWPRAVYRPWRQSCVAASQDAVDRVVDPSRRERN